MTNRRSPYLLVVLEVQVVLVAVLAVAGGGQDGDGVHGLDQGALGQGLRHDLAAIVRSHVSEERRRIGSGSGCRGAGCCGAYLSHG